MWMERMYFGTDHMIGQDDYMPYLKDKFEIRLYNVNSSELASFSDILTLSTDSLGEFKKGYGVIEDFYGNDSLKFAGKPTFQNVSWTIKGYVGLDSQQALVNLDKQVFDSATEKVGRPSRYMKDAYVLRDSGDGDSAYSRIWKWRGVWISSLGFGDADYKSSDIVKFNCTLEVSRAIYLGPMS
jgi:hypothetical protein